MTQTADILRVGLDIGSTTVKIAVLDGADGLLFQSYERHFSDVRKTVADAVISAAERFPEREATLAVAGSGGIRTAELLGLGFVQEVVAGAEAIRRFLPRTNVAVELGGEDAKLTFFDAGIDQRMNETCAGGTGAFIDQMATFLSTDPAGLNELAKSHRTIHPIAARCGVFAKADILPLLNEGAAREDIAASIFQSVVDQTVGGLACGRRISGRVAFLGGPLFFLSELRRRFVETLKLLPGEAVCPPCAQLFVAMGAALVSAGGETYRLSDLACRARDLKSRSLPPEISPLPPLFTSLDDLKDFQERHSRARLPRAGWPEDGLVFLGLDAGSTTTKLVALDSEARLLHSFYGHNHGNPLKSAMGALSGFYAAAPADVRVARSGVTGYGEALIQAALGFDLGEVETVAHYKAAARFVPDVSFIVDIGGQDIKCLSVRNGIIERLMLNEACSSGCGSFLETFASTLSLDAAGFAQAALLASKPADLGSRCTVFMNSKVKQAQKEGAPVGDISAGLSYSVVRNALYKVIRIARAEELGERIVVQGGTFFNDAVLRSFELSIGRDVVRPDIAGLMGAFGAALLAAEEWRDRLADGDAGRDAARGAAGRTGGGPPGADPRMAGLSGIIGREELAGFSVKSSNTRCRKCENRCLLTVNRFSDGRLFVSGNRCERGAASKSHAADRIDALASRAGLGSISETLARLPALGSLEERADGSEAPPNLFSWNLNCLMGVRQPGPLSDSRARVGIPRALGMYETYPFWHAFFRSLGIRVELSPPSSKELFNSALETIPSQTVCYPAKMVHGHVMALLAERPDFVFFPCTPLELPAPYRTEDRYNCPLVGTYPELVRLNMDAIGDSGVRLVSPFLDLGSSPRRLAARLKHELGFLRLGTSEIRQALKAGYEAQRLYRADVRKAGERALARLKGTGRRAIVLAGHPYHLDPGIHHGIPDLITANGLGVLPADSVDHLAPPSLALRVRDQWIPHSRLYRAAAVAAAHEELELVQLNSFGCGLDAVTTDQVSEIIKGAGKVYTLLKIDEGANLGAARIRVRSLLAAMRDRGRRSARNAAAAPYVFSPPRLLAKKAPEYTLLCPQMSPMHWRFVGPALEPMGLRLEILPHLGRGAVEEGLKFVNNDACYPALVSIGQILNELKSGRHDLASTAVLMSQTGGGCRASNYVALLRRALNESGMPQVPVWPLGLSGAATEKGLKLDRAAYGRAVLGLLFGDMLQRLVLASRPYERTAGDAEGLCESWVGRCAGAVRAGDKAAFPGMIASMADAFASLNLLPPDRPRVGVVGEILINFHPEANNQAVAILESEGGQAVLPELADFFLYCFHDDVFRADAMGGGRIRKWLGLWFIRVMERYRAPMRDALVRHPRFGHLNRFSELKEAGERLVSLGNQSGEGWYLAADMALMLEKGIGNILCLQPFGCLPNHVTGKGVVKELKRRYRGANIAAVDYDPGASEVNQLNRIKLLMSVARSNAESARECPVRMPDAGKDAASVGAEAPGTESGGLHAVIAAPRVRGGADGPGNGATREF
ncbi:MAG: acyl-CoA dehydratase activase-related protein [Deltaproteobacteria bacterium]|jgi:predicted CoA-substrate-specific enzyme activase|nr:acyl-CoA dehydratase activase-related protein [Deltaproteobacteria bacterium]